METEIELKALDGKTGTEKAYFLPFWNEIANEYQVEEYRANLTPRKLKQFNAAIIPVTITWVWKFGYMPRSGYPTAYRTNEVTTRDDTGERLGA